MYSQLWLHNPRIPSSGFLPHALPVPAPYPTHSQLPHSYPPYPMHSQLQLPYFPAA
ncbi:hypothetical protein BGX38DRAFT_1232957 [Terfezia claveryi]|nr:hypothetical protein BGX38DRAFT_1232957 [Terfezia claveryi]